MFNSWKRAALALGVVSLASGAFCAAAKTETSPATQSANAVPARYVRKANPIPADAGSKATGKNIYTSNCMACHGADGKGHGTAAHLQETPPADLTNSKYALDTDGALFWRISNGHRPMPKFENLLPDESRWNVVNYLRTWAKPTASAPATSPVTQPASSAGTPTR